MLVILNKGAGTAAEAKLEAEIEELFRAEGVTARIVRAAGDDLARTARAAIDQGEKTIVAAGGDGTISTIAGEVIGTVAALGVLPAGTLNHFAKDLGLPLELADAVRTITRDQVREVDVAQVNDCKFVNNSSLGIYPRIVAKREEQQEKLLRGKWPAFLWAALHAFRRCPFLELKISIDGRARVVRTAFLFVGNNPYEIAGFKLGGRKSLQRGKLGLYLANDAGRLGLIKLAFHALLGRLKQERDFEAFEVEEAIIHTRRPRVLVATDGEVSTMESPLRYRILPRALRVYAAAEKAS